VLDELFEEALTENAMCESLTWTVLEEGVVEVEGSVVEANFVLFLEGWNDG
jgi:hypothetical protein